MFLIILMATGTCFLIIFPCLIKKREEKKSRILCFKQCLSSEMTVIIYARKKNKTFLMVQDTVEAHTSFAVSFRIAFP